MISFKKITHKIYLPIVETTFSTSIHLSTHSDSLPSWIETTRNKITLSEFVMNDFTNIIKTITPPKTKLTIENKHLKTYCMMYLLLKMVIFHCHVSFLEGKTHNHEKRPHSGGGFQWNPLLFRENQLSTVFQFTFSPYAASAQEPCFFNGEQKWETHQN